MLERLVFLSLQVVEEYYSYVHVQDKFLHLLENGIKLRSAVVFRERSVNYHCCLFKWKGNHIAFLYQQLILIR